MATITLALDCTLLEDGGARISAEITASDGVPAELFLYKRGSVEANDLYSGVATPWEVTTYPDARDGAVAYYRQAEAVLNFDNHASAIRAKEQLEVYLAATVQSYADLGGDFEGESEIEIESV